MKILENVIRKELGQDFVLSRMIRQNDRGTLAEVRKEDSGERFILRIFRGNADACKKLAQIENAHLPRIYEVKETGGTGTDGHLEVLLLEEYIPGTTLFETIKEHPLSEKETKRIVLQLIDALSALHDAGLVHNDLKPENVLLDGERAVLIDFDSLSEEGKSGLSGTKGYAPPEQYDGKSGRAADIYALGVLINACLLGKHPSAELPNGKWGRIVEKCTMLSPKWRFRDVKKLENAISGRSRRYAFAAAAVLVFAVVCAVLFFTNRPKTYEGGAYIDYPFRNGTVRVLLSFDGGSSMDGHATEVLLDRLPPDMDSMAFSQLFVYDEGNEAARDAFMEAMESCEVETIPLEGTSRIVADAPEVPDLAVSSALRLSYVHYHANDGLTEIRWTVSMKNGDTIKLSQKIECAEMAVLQYGPDDTDLSTTEALNALLQKVKEEEDGAAIVELHLPPVRYEGPFVMDDLAVTLVGTTEGELRTTFTDTIEVNSRNPQLATIRNIAFEGRGGTGLLAHEAVIVEGCTFSGWDVAASAEEGSWIILEDCSFSENKTAFRFNSTMATASSDVYKGLTFSENEVAVELLNVPGNMKLKFENCTFTDNGKDLIDEAGLASR